MCLSIVMIQAQTCTAPNQCMATPGFPEAPASHTCSGGDAPVAVFTETFDAGFGVFTEDPAPGGFNDLTVSTLGDTPSFGTGPETTPGCDGGANDGEFIFLEGSSTQAGEVHCMTASIPIPTIAQASAPYTMSFWYHMFGDNIGTLEVFLNGASAWSLSDQQQTANCQAWEQGDIDVTALSGTNATVQICMSEGNGAVSTFESDISIDHLQVFGCTPPCVVDCAPIVLDNSPGQCGADVTIPLPNLTSTCVPGCINQTVSAETTTFDFIVAPGDFMGSVTLPPNMADAACGGDVDLRIEIDLDIGLANGEAIDIIAPDGSLLIGCFSSADCNNVNLVGTIPAATWNAWMTAGGTFTLNFAPCNTFDAINALCGPDLFLVEALVPTGPPALQFYSINGGALTANTGMNIETLPAGVHEIVYVAQDALGNLVTCTSTITINDVEPPMFANCPNDTTIDLNPGACDFRYFYNDLIVTDNCPLGVPVFLDFGSNCNQGTTGINCNAGGDILPTRHYRTSATTSAFPVEFTTLDVGVAIDPGGAEIEVMIYELTGAFPGGAQRRIAEGTAISTGQATPYCINVPLTVLGQLSPGGTVLVEVFVDGDVPNGFFLGYGPNVGVTWIESVDCGAATPTDLATFGVPGDLVLDLSGNEAFLIQVEGEESGVSIGPGVTTYRWEATDGDGNVGVCEWTVTVNEFGTNGNGTADDLACNDMIQVSLNQACEAEITPDMLLEGEFGCFDLFTVELFTGEPGVQGTMPLATSPFVTGDDKLETIWATITDTRNGNKCWGRLLVEDKLPPVMMAPPDETVSCDSVEWLLAFEPRESGTLSATGATLPVDIDPTAVATYTTSTTQIVGGTGTVMSRIVDANVNVGIIHTWLGDLDISVISPNGTEVDLITGGGPCGGNFDNIDATFDDQGAAPACGAVPAIVGSVTPEGSLADFNGQMPTGAWTLSVTDNVGADGGFIQGFSIDFVVMPRGALPMVDENCGDYTLTYEDIEDVNTCGEGEVRRVFTATDDNGNSSSVTQTWTVTPIDRPTLPGVISVSADCPISYDQLRPDDIKNFGNTLTWFQLLPDGSRGGQITANAFADYWDRVDPLQDGDYGDYCGRLAVSYTDELFDDCLPHGFKIRRTWKVIDWCDSQFEHVVVQTIKVEDNQAPTITVFPQDQSVSVRHNTCVSTIRAGVLQATDNCDSAPTVTTEFFDANGQEVQNTGAVGPGMYTVKYIVSDACDNVTSTTSKITVTDEIPPVAICFQYVVLSLTSDGWGEICCDQFDNGSYDNCPNMRKEIRIPGVRDQWAECHTLLCSHQGDHIVEVRVWDDSNGDGEPGDDSNGDNNFDELDDDNFNICWGNLKVEDKNNPFIICPPNVTVNCSEDLEFATDAPRTITNQTVLPTGIVRGFQAYPPLGPNAGEGAAWGGCAIPTITYFDVAHVGCVGIVNRTWTATKEITTSHGASTVSVSCTQQITVVDDTDPIFGFPLDIELSCTTVVGTEPTDLAQYNTYDAGGHPVDIYDGPYAISGVDCEQIGISKEDELFDICAPGSYKIKRTWHIIDWCDADFELFYEQEIVVRDITAPDLTINDINVCIENNSQDCGTFTEVVAVAGDDCTGVTITNDSQFSQSGQGADASGVYPKGVHTVTFRALDACGNVTEQAVLVRVRDCKAPQVNCQNLNVELKSNGTAEVCAQALDANSFDNCDDQINLNYSLQWVDADGNPLSDEADCITVTCDQIGIQFINLIVEDASGNRDFCTAMVDVQDNLDNPVCPDTPASSAQIAGNLETNHGQDIADVEMYLDGSSVGMNNGTYAIVNVPTNANHSIEAEKLTGLLEGVTTWDIVQIRKHVLNVDAFVDPYLWVAADINNDNKVSTFDILNLRQAILGVTSEFPNGQKSWRFVDEAYTFPTVNPLSQAFDESIDMMLMNDYMNADFVGVKIGDLSGDLNGRNAMNLEMILSDQEFVAGNEYEVTFSAKDFTNIEGYQFTLNFDANALEFVGIESGSLDNLTESNFGLVYTDRGMITTSWDNSAGVSLEDNDVLFTVTFRAYNNIEAKEALSITDVITANEAYDGENRMDVSLVFEGSQSDEEFVLYQNTPNPFRGVTTVGFNLPNAGAATLNVYDLTGKVIKSFNGDFAAGYNQIEIQSSDIRTAGVLYYELVSADHRATKKMIIIE